MIDSQKRQTLKALATSLLALTASSAAYTAEHSNLNVESPHDRELEDHLARISVKTQVNSSVQDVEVLIRNEGDRVAHISHMTPSQTVTRRGTFDFSKLFDNGDLVLQPGQTVSVSMTPKAVVLDSSTTAIERARSVGIALRKSFSVITDSQAFARVEFDSAVRVV
ncbi:MAG: hypothetical protein KTR32_08730 [Granulosicoccus sp.]|nr:hypothetical protein [Granulosicoccus sp.]